MLRGIRRLFGTLALLWAILWTLYLGPMRGGGRVDNGGEWLIFMGIAVAIYSMGWLVTYLANGFKKPRGRIIDQ